MLSRDLIQKALLLNDNGCLKIEIPGGESKLKSLRVSLYKAKKELDLEDEIIISFKKSTLILTKSVIPEIQIIETTVDELEKTYVDKSGITQTNIDGDRIKTIREKLSIFDKEKAMLAEQFKACKAEIESIEELSTEDKEFLISKSLENTNLSINHLNKKAKDLTLESKKSQ